LELEKGNGYLCQQFFLSRYRPRTITMSTK
jgi:hypothetical protein